MKLCETSFLGEWVYILGSHHEVATLKTLYKEAKGKVEALKDKAREKKDELSSLLKESDGVLTEYDEETEGMVQLIHKTRDEQVLDHSIVLGCSKI